MKFSPLKTSLTNLALPAVLVTALANLSASLLIFFRYKQPSWLLLIGLIATCAALTAVAIMFKSRAVNVVAAPPLIPQRLSREAGAVPEKSGAAYQEAPPLANNLWLKLVEQNVELVDELDRHKDNFDPSSQALAEHVIARLQEMLERSGVETISNDTVFNRERHQPQRGASSSSGAVIAETLSPGFALGPRILRRARVRLTEG